MQLVVVTAQVAHGLWHSSQIELIPTLPSGQVYKQSVPSKNPVWQVTHSVVDVHSAQGATQL